ncbi:MAG: tRNA (guanosine(46)-N7)-methyltransferase TrmB [Mycobacteriales bacterium]
MQRDDPIRTYKARRRLTTGQAAAIDRLLPSYGLTVSAPFDRTAVYGREAPLVLEIGSGMGEATAAMAAADPARDVLAVEVHTPGIGSLLRRIEDLGLPNVRVAEADGVDVLRPLAAGSVDEIRVFFPDPWPKSRHHKRRLLTADFADLVADRLRPGGRLHVATDCVSYLEQTVRVLGGHADLQVVSRERGSRPVTRFERQGLDAGREPHDVVAVRTAAG